MDTGARRIGRPSPNWARHSRRPAWDAAHKHRFRAFNPQPRLASARFPLLFTHCSQTLAYVRQSFTRFPTRGCDTTHKRFHACAPSHVFTHARCTCVVSVCHPSGRDCQSMFKVCSHGTHVLARAHTQVTSALWSPRNKSEPPRGPTIPCSSFSQALTVRGALSPSRTRYTLDHTQGRTLLPASRR